MRRLFEIAFIVALMHVVPCRGGAPTIQSLRDASAAGRHAQVLADVDGAIAALPASAKLTAWQIEFGGQSVEEVILGARYVYIVSESRRSSRDVGPPINLDDKRPLFHSDKSAGYTQATLVTCVDATNGQRMWTRSFLGPFRFQAGPGGDDLWAQGTTLFRLDATTGEERFQREVGKDWRNIHGVSFEGQVVLHEHDNSHNRPDRPRVIEAETGKLVKLPFRPSHYSPNRLRVVRRTFTQSPTDVTTTVSVTAPIDAGGDSTPTSSYKTPGYSSNDPVWMDDDDVLVLSGVQDTRGAVARVDAKSGEAKWTFLMPRGAYTLEQVYLPGNSHLTHRWDAVGIIAGHVAAIDGRGELVLLDPETGERRASTTRAPAHFAMPKQIGDNLILAGTDGVTAIPLDTLIKPNGDSEKDLLLLKARSLLATGNTRDAKAAAVSLTTQAPLFAEGWRVRAEVAEAMKDESEAVVCRVRVMETAGETRSAALEASHGLLMRIPVGAVSAALAPVGPFMYVGSLDGSLSKVDVQTLEVVDVTRVPIDITGLRMRDNTLFRWGTDRHDEPIATFAGLPPPLAREDPLYVLPAVPADAPREWHTVNGYDGRVIRLNGRFVRPLRGGGVRVLDGKQLTQHSTTLTGIESWNIHVAPDGAPLGYGTGGVYELDDRLVPVRRIVDSGTERLNRRAYPVNQLCVNESTFALVVRRSAQTVMQIWTRDGKRKLREESLMPGGRDFDDAARLMTLGKGYLYSGDELTWVPADEQAPVWRFPARMQPAAPMRHHGLRDDGFGVPRLINNRLFVAGREGGLFVFNADAVGRTSPVP